MIANYKRPELKGLELNGLIAILSSKQNIHFYLTGSRFFGNWGLESDWDFFVRNGVEVRSFLKELGFTEIPCETMTDLGYDQSQFSSIHTLTTTDGAVVQIQLVSDVYKKQAVQEMIQEYFLSSFNHMDKKQRKELWTLLLKTSEID